MSELSISEEKEDNSSSTPREDFETGEEDDEEVEGVLETSQALEHNQKKHVLIDHNTEGHMKASHN